MGKNIFVLFLFFFCCFSLSAKPWKKVYQNDENGKGIYGSKELLIKSIEKGKDVKVMLVFPAVHGQEFYTYAENIWIKNGEVTIQNASQISVTEDYKIQSDAYHWIIMINTKGEIQMSRWRLGEHSNKGDNSGKVSVSWFVR